MTNTKTKTRKLTKAPAPKTEKLELHSSMSRTEALEVLALRAMRMYSKMAETDTFSPEYRRECRAMVALLSGARRARRAA